MLNNPFSKKFYYILSLLVIALVAVLALLFTKADSLMSKDGRRQNANVRSLTRGEVRGSPRRTKSERKAEYDAIFAEVIRRNPGSTPEWKAVPYEENGWLQWRGFCKRIKKETLNEAGKVSFKVELDAILSDQKEWEHEDAAALMDKYAGLLDEMTSIGLLKKSSAAGKSMADHFEFMSPSESRYGVEFLLAGARFAAESGDDVLALERLKASAGIARHHYSVEASSSVNTTIGLVHGIETLNANMDYVLPHLELDESSLAELRRELRSPSIADTLEVMIQGEFLSTMRYLVIPLLTGSAQAATEAEIKDPEALNDAVAQGYLTMLNEVKGLSDFEILDLATRAGKAPSLKAPDHLTSESKEAYQEIIYNYNSYYSGLLRAKAIFNQHDAALAVLSGEEVPLEPISGKPYIFDEVERTLSLPEGRLLELHEIEPIKLPK